MRAALEQAGTELHAAAAEAVADEVGDVQRDARRLAPVKTGELRRKIQAESSDLTGEVKSTARHTPFVEHGTYRDKAQPFMAPAALLARRRLPKRAAKLIKVALESL
jgi:HK97 gp10 family phage protein